MATIYTKYMIAQLRSVFNPDLFCKEKRRSTCFASVAMIRSVDNHVLAVVVHVVEQAVDVQNVHFANCNISVEEKMVYLPVYMCTFIRDEAQLPILAPIL